MLRPHGDQGRRQGEHMLRVLACLLLLGLTVDPGQAMAASSPSIDDLTRQIFSLHAAHRQGHADALAAMVSTAEAREQRLSELIAEQPGLVIRQAIPESQRAALPAAVQSHVEQQQQLTGTLEILHEDGPSGSRYHYFLTRPDERLALHF